MSENIGETQIKGLRYKDLITLVTCTITIVISIAGTYFALKNDISDLRKDKESDTRYFNLRLETAETNLKIIQLQVTELDRKVNTSNNGK